MVKLKSLNMAGMRSTHYYNVMAYHLRYALTK